MNYKLLPVNAVWHPVLGYETKLEGIVQEYSETLSKRGIKRPSLLSLDASMPCKREFYLAFDKAYKHINRSANRGDKDAEKALLKIKELLDRSFPNYFVAQGDLGTNIRLAESGDVYAQGMLGDRYYYGRDAEQDYVKAVYWYRLSAEQGVKYAQFNLAGCYELGQGIDRDLDMAMAWYKLAAKNGMKEARWAVKRLKQQGASLGQYREIRNACRKTTFPWNLPTAYLNGQ